MTAALLLGLIGATQSRVPRVTVTGPDGTLSWGWDVCGLDHVVWSPSDASRVVATLDAEQGVRHFLGLMHLLPSS